MALDSVNYAEDRAMQILQIVQDEEEQRQQLRNNLPSTTHFPTSLPCEHEEIDSGDNKSSRSARYVSI